MNVLNTEIEAALDIERPSFSTAQSTAARAVIRVTLVAATCCVALFVPFFAEVMSLVGAMCL